MGSTKFVDLPALVAVESGDQMAAARGGETGRISVGEIATAAAALVVPGQAGSGMPVFAAANANIVYDPATHTVGGPLNNFVGSIPSPAMMAVIMPTDLDRKAEALIDKGVEIQILSEGDFSELTGVDLARRDERATLGLEEVGR